MSAAGQKPERGRETRLLLATIAISVAVLVLLARFRFPEEVGRPMTEPVQAPLERLAARATYDELAAIMADLERRLLSRLVVVQIQPERAAGSFAIAPRVAPTRAVALIASHETLAGGVEATPILARDHSRDLAVLAVPEVADGVVTLAAGTPRPGPRYVAVVEATAQGPVVRPVYVGRTDLFQDPRTTTPLLSIAALQQYLPRGAALFSLAGNFIGLASEGGASATVIPGDILRAAAESAHEVQETRGDLGITVQPLTRALTRATGAERGVVVSYVHPRGPAHEVLESGDVVTAIDGTGVTTPAGFQQVVQSRTPRANARLDLIRRGKPLEVEITVRDATGTPLPPLPPEDPGLVLRAIPELGVEVVTVRPGGAAARAGVAAGDIVLRVDGRDAPTPAILLAAFRQAEPGEALLLSIQRGAEHRVLALEK